MRLLLIGPFSAGFLAESYATAFEMLGHEVFRFDSDRAYLQSAHYAANPILRRMARSILWGKVNLSTIEVARCIKPQLIISFKGAYLNPDTIRFINSSEGIPFVNYYPDNPYCGVPLDPRKTSAQRHDLLDALREYRHVFTWERNLVQHLLKDGVSASYLPFGVDSTIFHTNNHYECTQCGINHEIVFVGQHTSKREKHIKAIKRYRVALWHDSWNWAGEQLKKDHIFHTDSVFGPACSGVYTTAGVSLNIVDNLNMPGHNMRTFEIPASGGIMVSIFTEEQAAIFPEGEAAFYYHVPEEIDDIIERILEDKPWQKKIRENALRLAQDHTYVHRATELLAKVFG